MTIRAPILLLIAALGVLPANSADKSFDIVIAGAGSGGVSAAIQAARMGASVALLEETDWVGGQSTAAAVSTMDEGRSNLDSGIYKEFIDRVRSFYAARGKSIGACYWSDNSQCFEPKVGQQIMLEMLRETGHVELMLRTRVVRATSEGKRVTGVVTSKSDTLRSQVLIDATEFGDVLPLSPARWRVGKYTTDNVDPKGCVQWITYAAVVKKYPQGVPEELKLKTPPPGYDEELRQRFRRDVQIGGNPLNRVLPVNWPMHNAYRGLPDSSNPENYIGRQAEKITKTVINWFNDFPVTIGGFEPAERKMLFCAAKLRTLQFLYYMQHDLGESQWAVANDEGYDTPYNREENLCDNIPAEFKAIERHFPVMPYIRESRRLAGVHTLTSLQIRREGTPPLAVTNFPNSIAIGDYAVDLHGCNADSTLESEFEHSGDTPPGARKGPFQVPLESLIPAEVDGLLAAEKNISQTRLANGATRLQPITMLTGEAAGVLAALAVKSGVPPRKVHPFDVQEVLLTGKSTLALPKFKDVPKEHPLWAAVQMAVTHEWIVPAGMDTFGIGDPVTRGEAAAILARRAGLAKGFNVYRGSPADVAAFTDVPLYHRVAADVEALYRAGVIPADKNPKRFFPDQPMRAGDFRDLTIKLFKLPANALPLEGGEANITRGQAAQMLWRIHRGPVTK